MKYSFYITLFLCTFLLSGKITSAQHKKDKLHYTGVETWLAVTVKPVTGNKVKNVILMVGDGMGLNQVSAAWIANKGRLSLDNFPVTGLSRTTAANKLITDSGAAGTAMASGKKTNYHSVGVDTEGNALPSLTTLANKKGLSTGIVVTCNITDATPAAFCGNNVDRNDLEEIATDFLQCNVDYIFGGGSKEFNQRADKRNLIAEMRAKGYQTPATWEETRAINNGKVLALLNAGQLPLADKRGKLHQEAAMHAINMLSKNKHGFFAMIEGSRIDDCGHWNDLPKLVSEIGDFDQTIGRVLQWAEKDGETLVIVLADHETGGLTLLDGDVKKGAVQCHFSTSGHSGILVPVYAYGPQAATFGGIYENTEVFEKIKLLLNL